MSDEVFRSAAVVVADPARSRFFLQQKDESYPRFPLGWAFFGGGIESGETARAAVLRELDEELEPAAAAVIGAALGDAVFEGMVDPGQAEARPFHFTLLEAVVADARLEALAGLPVREGRRGVVVARAELSLLPFVWGLEAVVRGYLDRIDADD